MMKHAYASLHCTGNARQRVSTSNRACTYLETLPRDITRNGDRIRRYETHTTTLSNNASNLQTLDDVRGSDNFERALNFIDVIDAQLPTVGADTAVNEGDAAQLIGLEENYNGFDDGFGDDVVREIKGRGENVVAYLNDKLQQDGLAFDTELPDGSSDRRNAKSHCRVTRMAVAVGFALQSCSTRNDLFGLGPVCHSLRLAQALRCGLVNGYNMTESQNFILQALDKANDAGFQEWWNTVSRSHQRNLIMALGHSVTNDDLHCQSLLGADSCHGVRSLEVPCHLLFDSRYASDLPTDGGATSHVVVSEDGVVAVETLNHRVKFSYFEGSHPDQSMFDDELGERVTCLYHVPASNEVHVPVLARGDRMVVDLRPDQVITHAYKTSVKMDRDEDTCCPMTTSDLYEKLDLMSVFKQNLDADQPDWLSIEDVTFAYKKTENDADAHPRILGTLYDEWNVDGALIVDTPYMEAHDDNRLHADSHRGSVFQISQRYGSIEGESVLGYDVPIAVEAIQFPTVSETPMTNFLAGIGFAEPRPCKTVTAASNGSLRVVDSPLAAAAAVVAPLSIRPPHAGPKSQMLINAPAVTPSHGELATQLSRPGRRNIVGVALQKMEPGQPGDIMLYDS